MVEPASAGFQVLPATDVTALVRDKNLEEGQVVDEIGQPECLALYLPLDLLQYYQSLYLLSMHVEKETGVQPAVTSSGPDQPPLQAKTTSLQVGQGH